MKRFLVTGGAGFIGSWFVRQLLASDDPPDRVISLDKLTYAGSRQRLEEIGGNPRHEFVQGDIQDEKLLERLLDGIDVVVNFAAESHVDRSIAAAMEFMQSNVIGAQILLDAARRSGVKRFVQISTDEVYGSLGATGVFTETSSLSPTNPYAASKAAADLLGLAAYRTYGFPVVITRTVNNYGPYQYPEKLIPLLVANAMKDRPLPIYGDGTNIRSWIHVEDNCAAIRLLVEKGRPGEIYNISTGEEASNIQIAKRIVQRLGKPEKLIQFVPDRPGHDFRYALESTKLRRETGWSPRIRFEEGLNQTIEWYRQTLR